MLHGALHDMQMPAKTRWAQGVLAEFTAYIWQEAHSKLGGRCWTTLTLRSAGPCSRIADSGVQVILLTDADVDGAHIRTLLLTFLFRYARDLFEKGHIYVGVPPLYKLERGRKEAKYLYNEAELSKRTQGLTQGSYNVQRFKVLLFLHINCVQLKSSLLSFRLKGRGPAALATLLLLDSWHQLPSSASQTPAG